MLIIKKRRWRVVLVLLIPVLTGFGPCTTGPQFLARLPGGVISGEVASESVSDWSFIEGSGLCAVETRPGFPHSVTVYCFTGNKKLYVGCMGCATKLWSKYVANDPRVRIKAAGKVYPVTMNRIEEPALLAQVWSTVRGRGSEDRPVPDGYWMYELTSR